MIANNGIYFSQEAFEKLRLEKKGWDNSTLTARQLEALSLCAAYPECSTADIAEKLEVTNSTLRNLLSSAYMRLNVRSRSAAIARLRQRGLITSNPSEGG